MRDAYEILQVSPNAETEVIEAAYRRLARKYHPDTNPSADATSRMQELNWAYEILHDPIRRKRYDTSRTTSRKFGSPYATATAAGPPPAPSPQQARNEAPPSQSPPAPPERPIPQSKPSSGRRFWLIAGAVLLAYLIWVRSGQGPGGAVSGAFPQATNNSRMSPTQVDPYAACMTWTETTLHDGQTVCVKGRILIVTHELDYQSGSTVWTAHFSFDKQHDFSLISADEDISAWQGHCVVVYGNLFDRSTIAKYVEDVRTVQPSMVTGDPYVARNFTIAEAPGSLCQ